MNLGLLALRVVVGALFMGHGAQKLFGYFRGAGLEGTAQNFERSGLRPGRLHAELAGCAELGGGLLLAGGLLTPLAAAGLIGVMTAAVITVHARNGVWASEGGYEYNLVMIAVAFAVTAIGPGAWSLDSAFGFSLAGTGWALAALAAGLCGGIAAVVSSRPQAAPGIGGRPTSGIHST
jgi:putative oxidoreductase